MHMDSRKSKQVVCVFMHIYVYIETVKNPRLSVFSNQNNFTWYSNPLF